jgi:proteasome lid subunit RPN8/RPN11
MQAYILRPELQKFTRRAWKAYAKRKEYVEAMFGVIHDGIVVVSAFYPVAHTADSASCDFLDEPEDMFDDLTEAAKDMGLKLIGTIHSHPGLNTCRHLSNEDVRHSQSNARHEILTGTIHLFTSRRRKHSQTQFTCLWEPVDVKFITSKGKLRRN